MTTLTGRVEGQAIALDEPVPELEGKRVRLVVHPVEETDAANENAAAWQEWTKRGPHGPLEDEDEPEFP